MKIGLPNEYFSDALNKEIRAAIDTKMDQLKNGGAKIVEVSLS